MKRSYEPKIIEKVYYEGGNGGMSNEVRLDENGYYRLTTEMTHFGVPLTIEQPLPNPVYLTKLIKALTLVRDELEAIPKKDRPYAYYSGAVRWIGGSDDSYENNVEG